MKIKEVTTYSPEIESNINQFLKVLTDKNVSMSAAALKEFIDLETSHLFFVYDDLEDCVGMMTIATYISPTGKKAWIEDVVVGEKYQGMGIGKKLISFAIKFAKEKQVSLLSLTSNPSRVAANKLYQKQGFERKETNVYKMNF